MMKKTWCVCVRLLLPDLSSGVYQSWASSLLLIAQGIMGILLWSLEPFHVCSMATPTSHLDPPLSSLFQSTPHVSETCCKLTDEAVSDTHTHTHTHTHPGRNNRRTQTWMLWTNMGQILSWIRGPPEAAAQQDVAVEEQVCVRACMCVCDKQQVQKFLRVLCCVAVRRDVLACVWAV